MKRVPVPVGNTPHEAFWGLYACDYCDQEHVQVLSTLSIIEFINKTKIQPRFKWDWGL